MLPYHEYPEGGQQNGMGDSELFVGYLHSDTLKWSFGITKETDQDAWNVATAAMSAQDMVQELKSKGFSGIYINRKGYASVQLWQKQEQDLSEYLNQTPVVSEDGSLSFFKIQ